MLSSTDNSKHLKYLDAFFELGSMRLTTLVFHVSARINDMTTNAAFAYQNLLGPAGTAQCDRTVTEPKERSGVHKLMAALLLDGIEAYIHEKLNPSKNRKTHDEICSWIESSEPGYVFSFENVCETLGIDPAYLQLGIQRFIQAKQADGTKGAAWKKIRRERTPKQEEAFA